jgi:hydroxymethylglutaryl-CoA lyase
MPDRVRITDVSPRDGLQNEPGLIPTADKVRLVELLGAAGVDEVEVSSFVSPKWVPQLADAADVFAALRGRKPPGVAHSALVPNEPGMRAALRVNEAAGERLIDKVAVFTAASETFCRRNTNATIAETLERFAPVLRLAQESGLPVRGYVSCAVQCPYEGPIAPQRVADVAARLLDLGVDEIDLGETIGAGTPDSVSAMLEAVMARLGTARGRAAWPPLLTLHLHDTFGRAAECVRAALRLGVRSFDGAAGGLGGCPFASTPARRAPGNIATETLARVVVEEGYAVGLSTGALATAAAHARGLRAGA